MPNPYSSNQADQIPDDASSSAARVRETASDVGQTAVDETRSRAAGGLDAAASATHHKADALPGGEAVRGAAHATADALSSSADYIRENDAKSMFADVQKLVKSNPVPVLLTVAVLGFLAARLVTRTFVRS